MIGKAMVTLLLALMASAQAVYGQADHQHGQQGQDSIRMMDHGRMCMGMMGGGDRGMGMTMMSGGPSPAMILRASDELALTAEQVTRLEAMRTRSTEAIQPHMQRSMTAHQRALQALQGDSPDLTAYELALKEAANHMVVMHVAAARAGAEARAALTADQRARLTRTMTLMRGMMGGNGMMMQHGPGTQSQGTHPRSNR